MTGKSETYFEEKINLPSIIMITVLTLISFIPLLMNYKYNDHHLNTYNHDYGKNLMMCSEEGSVFMTEGGDNQVFSTLYFMYSEKLRPDLSPYDQKGNIFKRIYGDMRYIDPQTLERRMDLVDTMLFSGEEPFYVNIRDRADPYFIPYWQGVRPVYLTWERPEPWTLGDYYYKRYGIMYKVQDIEYSLVDYLEIKNNITIDAAAAHFSDRLKRNISIRQTMEWIADLQKMGYVKVEADRVYFVKMYPAPYDVDYFDKMFERWREAPNAKYWDFLTREIVIGLGFQMGEIYRSRAEKMKEIRKRETRPEILKDIDRRIKENMDKAKHYYQEALYFGEDSITALYNISVVLLNHDIEGMNGLERDLLAKALKLYRNSWGLYNMMFRVLIIDSLDNPQNESQNLKTADEYFNQLKNELMLYASSQGDYRNHEVWGSFAGLENYINVLKQSSGIQLENQMKQLDAQIQDPEKGVNNQLAQNVINSLLQRGMPFQYQPYLEKASQYVQILSFLKQNDPEYQAWMFQFAPQIGRSDLAYQAGKQLEVLAPQAVNHSFNYSMGVVCQSLGKPQEAAVYLSRFLNQIQQDRKASIQFRQQIENAKQILQQIQNQ